ncbi:MAG: NAD-dependent epimerase/dehydratase family protein [Phycisphaeraceae bacterium]
MPERPTLAPTALIVGCGYLGMHLAARLIGRGVTVFGTTRSETRARQLARLGVQPLIVHVTQPVTLAALRPALEADALDVYYMIPPGRPDRSPTPRQTILGGAAHVLKALRNSHANVRRAVLVSSTAVYGQADGQRIDADTPPHPTGERSRLLLEGETHWLTAGRQYHVLRLAGIYGPTRIIGQRALQDGAPLIGNPDALLNLIHVDDAAALLIALMTADAPARVELGCDGHPVPRLAYYTHLAQRLGVPAPEVIDDEQAARQFGLNLDRLRRSASKALDNIRTCQRTGWTPQYPTYRQGLDAALQQQTS